MPPSVHATKGITRFLVCLEHDETPVVNAPQRISKGVIAEDVLPPASTLVEISQDLDVNEIAKRSEHQSQLESQSQPSLLDADKAQLGRTLRGLEPSSAHKGCGGGEEVYRVAIHSHCDCQRAFPT